MALPFTPLPRVALISLSVLKMAGWYPDAGVFSRSAGKLLPVCVYLAEKLIYLI